MTNSSSDVTAAERFYAASGPMATSVMECDEHYYAECLMYGRGAVTVWLCYDEVEHVAGTRYLDAECLRCEENEGALEIIISVWCCGCIRQVHGCGGRAWTAPAHDRS